MINTYLGERLFLDPSERGETVRGDSQSQTCRTRKTLQHGSHPPQARPARFVIHFYEHFICKLVQ